MPATGRRTARDERRRRLGQNFLEPSAAERFVAEAGVEPGELVLDIGAGAGAISMALARAGADVLAVEVDPIWADRLRRISPPQSTPPPAGRIRVIEADFLRWRLPKGPFRVVACPPFASTTAILRRLLDDPVQPLVRADLVLQWEVARKRAAEPPATALSVGWAPWWRFRLGARIEARRFRPVPRVDAGVLVIERRQPALLPLAMARSYAAFVHEHWPFAVPGRTPRRLRSGARSWAGHGR